MFLSLWVHGTCGEADKPCGEIDIFAVSGEKIGSDVLKILVSDRDSSVKMDWFGELPTERALTVEVEIIYEDGEVNLLVVGFFEEPPPVESKARG